MHLALIRGFRFVVLHLPILQKQITTENRLDYIQRMRHSEDESSSPSILDAT